MPLSNSSTRDTGTVISILHCHVLFENYKHNKTLSMLVKVLWSEYEMVFVKNNDPSTIRYADEECTSCVVSKRIQNFKLMKNIQLLKLL